MREEGAGLNETLERPAVLRLLPDLRGARAVDLGCGDGSLCRELVDRGAAEVTGVDPSARMLDLAHQRTSEGQVTYIQAFAEDFVARASSVDTVVSSLVLHYLSSDGFKAVIRAVASWLRPGGSVVVSMEHPAKTASLGAEPTLRNYADEGPKSTHWFTDGVVKHHSTLATICGSFHEAGLTITQVLEPMPTVALVRARPDLAVHRQTPPILVLKAQRGA
jgi:2-polyprenyl-3-methyl-5-hydroxy-6-metoxy-1,4-benzoquinol methylase